MTADQMSSETIVYIIKIAFPLLLIFGTFGSIMTIIVFRRLKDYSSISTYYIALALSDLMSLYFGWMTQFWLQYQFDVAIRCLQVVFCKMTVFVPYMSSALSSWYLAVMTMQRAMSVVWPHRVNVVCTRSVSRVVTVVITLVITATYSHVLYGVTLHETTCNNLSCAICKCEPTYPDYIYFHKSLWTWIDLLVASVGPFVVLIVCNVVLVRKVLTAARNARHRLAVGQTMHVTARQTQASSLSVTLIALCVTFFVLTGPVRVHLIASPYITLSEANLGYSLNQSIFFAVFLLFSVNSAVNFYLYFLTGTKFRKEVTGLLCGSFKNI